LTNKKHRGVGRRVCEPSWWRVTYTPVLHLYSPQMLRALSEYSVKTSVVTNTIVVREELKIKLDSTGRE